MSTGTQTQSTVTEIWTISTKRGPRYYFCGRMSTRQFPMSKAEAELKLATGAAVLIPRPWLFGGER